MSVRANSKFSYMYAEWLVHLEYAFDGSTYVIAALSTAYLRNIR